MTILRVHKICAFTLFTFACFPWPHIAYSQARSSAVSHSAATEPDADLLPGRARWFLGGREAPRGQSAAELRRRAIVSKMQLRALRTGGAAQHPASTQGTGPWAALGPVPLASDATGSGLQDYHQVSGRATAVAIDPADPSGNTVFIGGALGGVWKSSNAADPVAVNVTWSPLSDSQPTLAIGALVIQPGNSDPGKTVIIAATGEANNSGDSYFGAGMLRSADGGATWTNIPTATNGSSSVPFSGLGGTRMAFSTAAGQANTVVAAMATSAEAYIDGAYSPATVRGLYTSTDAGQTWSYDSLTDPGGQTSSASATSVVYNAGAGLFFAAVRYHGFYTSPDGLNWTRLANQPGPSGVLNATSCPPTSSASCPIYRAEITVVPGRNEMYAWFIGIDPTGLLLDEGIWQTTTSGTQWTQISDAGITSCGDPSGCGISQGAYDLTLLALPDGTVTDLYAGAINLYKCKISPINPTCSSSPFINLTHVYGCPILSAPAHVHPDQHALAFILPGTGTDLMYFANDGGIYRALDGYTGLSTGSCSGTNLFDDLNQNLGPMTQFVALSLHPTDPNTLLGGTQDNGSPASSSATTDSSWINVLGGDGGYNAIDPNTPTDWFTSNPDSGNGGLQIYLCSSGIQCDDTTFAAVVSSASVGGDDGPFYPFYALDPQSTTSMLVGTCRLWRGPRLGGTFSVLSPNFETFGSGTCTGQEANTVRSIAAGGPVDANGSQVVYATTDGLGPNNGIASGRVWVSTQASLGPASFTDITGSINPLFYPISSAVIDSTDPSGNTAFVSIMGFTGGSGHVWQTTNASSWTDFTGNGSNALPDSPVNALLIDASTHTIYAATDVGVFESSSIAPGWTEVGPGAGANGFLPNVAVTGLAMFDAGGQKLLRAATYGRGIWQFGIFSTPSFQIAVPTTNQTIFNSQTASFVATLTAYSGYNDLVDLTCTGGSTAPPQNCAANPASVTPTTSGSPTTLTASGPGGTYSFTLHAAGTDPDHTTHDVPITLQILDFGLTTPSPSSVTIPRGTSSSPINFQATAAGSFNQPVTVTCQLPNPLAGSTCTVTPQSPVNPTANSPVAMTAVLVVPAVTAPGSYSITLQADTAGEPAPVTSAFTAIVTTNPDFLLSEPVPFPKVKLGSTGTSGPISITSQDGFNAPIAVKCSAVSGGDTCSVSPNMVSSYPATVTLTINGDGPMPGTYSMNFQGVSAAVSHSISVPFNVNTFLLSGPSSVSATPGNPAQANLTLTSEFSYAGQVNVGCDASALAGAQCSPAPANPITLSAGGTANLTAAINVPNDAPPGTYTIKIQGQDVDGAPLRSLPIPLTVVEDYTIGTISPPTATVTASNSGSAPYNLSVIPVGATYNGPIHLNCIIAPVFIGSCTFIPATVTPAGSAISVVMTVATVAPVPGAQPRSRVRAWTYAGWLVVPAFVVSGFSRYGRRRIALWALLSWLGLATLSCGGGTGVVGGGQRGTNPGVYTITVTGVPGSMSQPNGSATSLTVQ